MFFIGKRQILSYLLCLCVFFVSSIPCFAQHKTKVEIIPVDAIGKANIPVEDLIFEVADSLAGIKKLKHFSDDWISKGYIASSFDSLFFDSLSIMAFYHLGARYLWDSLKIGNIPQEIVRKAGFTKGFFKKKSLNLKEFLRLREEIIMYYENIGYPFVQVKIDDVSVDNELIKGHIIIESNSYFQIGSIIIKGNPGISGKYLYYYIDITQGEAYNQSKINYLGKAIEDLPYLQMAKPSEIEFREGKADLFLYLKNKPANFFSGIIGFASGTEENPDFQITGDLNLVLVNAFKIGEQLEIYWDKYGVNSQNLKLGFQFPYLFFLPIGIDFQFGLEKFNVDYLNTSLYGGIEYSFSTKNKIKAYVSQKNSYLIDNELDTVNTLGKSSRFTAGLSFFVDKTDYRFNPREGFFVEASSGYGNRNTSLEASSGSIIEFSLQAAFYLKVGTMGTIALVNHSAGMYSDYNFYENELFKIGGINSLRGFDEQSIFVSTYSILSIEPRLLLGKNSAIYLFSDFAWYESKLIDKHVTDYPMGFGLGINVDTRAGIFKLNYALGKQFDNPVKISDSKVHFGFSARF